MAIVIVPAMSTLDTSAISRQGILQLLNPRQNESSNDRNNQRPTRHQDKEAEPAAQPSMQQVQTPVGTGTPQKQPPVAVKSQAAQGGTISSATVPVSQAEASPPQSPDTAIASRVLSQEQSKKSVQPVVYESTKMSSDRRDSLLHVSLMGVGAASFLYAASYAGLLWRLFYGEPVPARRSMTQQN